MKEIFRLILTGLVTAGLFSACVPPFEPELNERYNLQSEKSSTDLGITVSALSSTNAALVVQPQTGMDVYPQRITLKVDTSDPLTTANFDIGTDKKIKGLSIYPLKAVTDSYTLYEEAGSGLAYTAYPIGKNQVELLLPFTEAELKQSASPTSWLVLKLDPTQVTFNGGKGKLNTDGDTLPGEAEEDFFALYYTNVRPTATGTYSAPTQGMKYINTARATPWVTTGALASNFLNYGGSSLDISGFSIDNSLAASAHNTPFDSAGLVKAYRFEKFDRQTGNWKPLIPENPAFTAGVLTLRFGADAPGPLDIVRYMVDPYLIVANIKAGGPKGATLRASYNQFLHKTIGETEWRYSNVMDTNPASIPYLTINNAVALTTTPSASLSVRGEYRSYYIDLTVTVNNPGIAPSDVLLDLESLRQAAGAGTGTGTGQTAATQSNIRIFQMNGMSSSGSIIREISFDRSRIELKGPAEFRIHLPQDYGNYSDNAYLEIHIINAKAAFRAGAETKTAAFWKPNGTVDYTGSYRFRVKGPSVPLI
jgi:hypothetical protein